MRIRIVKVIASGVMNEITKREALQTKSPDTEIEVVNIDKGPDNIESSYEEALASVPIIEKVVQAEKDGCDGVFISCFGDPAVDASREQVKIPVVGGFQPAALTASLISSKWSIVTVSKNVIPLIRGLARKLGVENSIVSIREINTPFLELLDENIIKRQSLIQIEKAVDEDGAEAVVLGCTGLGRVAENLSQQMAAKGKPIPVVSPTAAAIGFLELLIRIGVSQSRLTYRGAPDIKRRCE